MVCQSVCLNPANWLNQSRSRLGCGLRWHKEPCIRWGVQIPSCEGAVLRGEKWRPTVKYRLLAVQKQLNRSRCHLGCGLGVLDGDAHWRHLANAVEPTLCGSLMSDYFTT